ncbi:MAG TPA: hypothetical protein VKR05_06400 [Candidatus Cybelea sp.]|nr:hypothetical protein [Candidatus Cybelea sp.]
MRVTRKSPLVEVAAGYAAGAQGAGVAYACVSGDGQPKVWRVGFRVRAPRECRDRAAGYAALTALVRALFKRGIRAARFVIGDEEFAREIRTGDRVDERLALPYVRLRCAMNSLANFDVQAGCTDDLTQRARAEAALNVAA